MRESPNDQSYKRSQSLPVWAVLMAKCLPERLRMKEDRIIEIPLVPVEDVDGFCANRQKKPECQHSICGQHDGQRPEYPTIRIVYQCLSQFRDNKVQIQR